MFGGNGLTVDGLKYPVAPPRFNASPRPSTSGEVQYSGAAATHPTPIPQWDVGPSNFSSPEVFGSTCTLLTGSHHPWRLLTIVTF